jgi:hypothetical protein
MGRTRFTVAFFTLLAGACASSVQQRQQSTGQSEIPVSGASAAPRSADFAGRWSTRFSDGSRLTLELQPQDGAWTGTLRGAPNATEPEVTIVISGEVLGDTLIVRDAYRGAILEGVLRGARLVGKVRDSRRFESAPLGERLNPATSSSLQLSRER